MATRSKPERQALGCGYEPAADAMPWQPPEAGYHGPRLTTCAGYTANLPEVMEAALTRAHWKVGAVVAACEGEMPSPDLLDAILILDAGYSHLEAWLMKPAKDGGGGS
jgi:hypothetical protein